MSYSVRLQLYDGKAAKPNQFPVPWWDKDELMREFKFNSVYDNGYFEYFCELDKNQLKHVHEQQLEHITEGIYADKYKRDLVVPYAETIDHILESEEERFKKIQVDIYEFD